MFIDGKEAVIRKPLDAINAGIGFVTEDRKTEGLILCRDCKENISIAALRDFVRGLDQEQRIRFVDALFEVLTCTNAETLTDLKDGGFRTAYSMLKTVRSLDPDTRQALSGTLGLLVRSGAKSVSQSQPIQRLKNWRLVDWISKKLAHGDET